VYLDGRWITAQGTEGTPLNIRIPSAVGTYDASNR